MAKGRTRRVDAVAAAEVVAGGDGVPGLLWEVLGFHTGTTKFRAVHMMNDLAQALLRGAPEDGGEFLCRVIRDGYEGEHNEDPAFRADERFGGRYRRAYPEALGVARTRQLRRAAELLLNFDKGMYAPGDRMASAAATHQGLLGFDGFRRFAVGRYLGQVLGEEGRARVLDLYQHDGDPVTRALAPLLSPPGALYDTHPDLPEPQSCPFDKALGSGLTTLIQQPLSKPVLLRYLALGAGFGLILKALGAGRTDGRPAVLVLPARQERQPLREQAVQSFQSGLDALDSRLAARLPEHPLAERLTREEALVGRPTLEVQAGPLAETAMSILVALRNHKVNQVKDVKEREVYWPEVFAIALGRKLGCVLPREDRAGWGKYLCLTPEMAEVLILMQVPSTDPPRRWNRLWAQIRDGLGIVVGADPHTDARVLAQCGVLHIDRELLKKNGEEVLRAAVTRGVARRLPDAGAEAGGSIQ